MPSHPRRKAIRAPRATAAAQPVFGQPQLSPDPSSFVKPHPSDSGLYRRTNNKLVQPVPEPRSAGSGTTVEPVLTLAEVYGDAGPAKVVAIEKAGQVVFHCVGDTGSVKGPETQSLVADKMVSDFNEVNRANVPSFFFHLGDVVYSFGEGKYYYDQFYEPYRDYPGPIIAIPGNHDGLVYGGDSAPTLDAFLRNFCAPAPVRTAEAGGLLRTAMIAPSVYFTLESPFVRILGLYSNVLEDPGIISSEGGTRPQLDDRQLNYLTAALKRCKQEKYAGAVILAVHHPPFTGGVNHSGSPRMLEEMDKCCEAAGFWPHAVVSGHAHNYQRYTRSVAGLQVPYLVAGDGGHGLARIRTDVYGQPVRTPYPVTSTLSFDSYDDTKYGYLRVIVNAQKIRIEYHTAADGTTMKTPDDQITVDLKTRVLS